MSIAQRDKGATTKQIICNHTLFAGSAKRKALQGKAFGFCCLLALHQQFGQGNAGQNSLTTRPQLLAEVNGLAQLRFGGPGGAKRLQGQPKIDSRLGEPLARLGKLKQHAGAGAEPVRQRRMRVFQMLAADLRGGFRQRGGVEDETKPAQGMLIPGDSRITAPQATVKLSKPEIDLKGEERISNHPFFDTLGTESECLGGKQKLVLRFVDRK